jgi:predicted ribosome quality control (RQC) complex YloA/Tae2 family protein
LSRPNRATLARFASLLDPMLAGTHIERVWRPTDTSLLIDLRALGKARLLVMLHARAPWVAVTERWPETPAAPDRETLSFRKCLEGARIRAVTLEDDRRLVLTLAQRHEHEPVLAIQLAGRYPNAAVLDRPAGGAETELVRLIADRPAIDPDSPALPAGEVPFAELAGDAWLRALSDGLWVAEDARRLDVRRLALQREARTAHERKRRAVAALEADLARARGAEAVRHRGELLKSAFHLVKPGQREIGVVDWADPEARTVVIDLDPALAPSENLQRLFARYRKLARGEAAVAERLESARRAEEELARLLAELLTAAAPDELDALEARLRRLGVRAPARPEARAAGERLPYRRFVAADGSEILVGKSARDNDELTFHLARGTDIFLHTRDAPGSHVILRRAGRADPAPEALLDAAALAAWASRLRDEPLVDVLYTEKKHLRKPRGAAPGLVQTAAPRTLTVRRDAQRIERLYATLDPHERET